MQESHDGAGDTRSRIARARRVVLKIGSSSLTDETQHAVDPAKMDAIADAVEARTRAGSEVIVVSSGAVASAMGPLGLRSRPRDLATKQAAAAVGQVRLVNQWAQSFGRYYRGVGQVLLTASDAGVRERVRNAQRTLDRLLAMGIVPIVNENDTVATAEFRFGDNDRLAAIVANLVSADALVLLSDVDGLYDRDPAQPGARFLTEVRDGSDLVGVEAGGGGPVGTGGMASKVSAAGLATRGGIPVLLAAAGAVADALGGARCGTVFCPREDTLSAWKFWALYAADAGGMLRVDRGAMRAIVGGGASLLAVGVTEVDGDFDAGEIVDILGPGGEVVGRGEVAFSSAELVGMMGKHSSELPEGYRRAVVHADHLSATRP